MIQLLEQIRLSQSTHRGAGHVQAMLTGPWHSVCWGNTTKERGWGNEGASLPRKLGVAKENNQADAAQTTGCLLGTGGDRWEREHINDLPPRPQEGSGRAVGWVSSSSPQHWMIYRPEAACHSSLRNYACLASTELRCFEIKLQDRILKVI